MLTFPAPVPLSKSPPFSLVTKANSQDTFSQELLWSSPPLSHHAEHLHRRLLDPEKLGRREGAPRHQDPSSTDGQELPHLSQVTQAASPTSSESENSLFPLKRPLLGAIQKNVL